MGKPGVKDDGGKLRWDLLPWKAVEGAIKVLTKGAIKYVAWGWKTVPNPQERYEAAMFRHWVERKKGNKYDIDPNCEGCKVKTCTNHTGERHIDQVVVNAMFLAELED